MNTHVHTHWPTKCVEHVLNVLENLYACCQIFCTHQLKSNIQILLAALLSSFYTAMFLPCFHAFSFGNCASHAQEWRRALPLLPLLGAAPLDEALPLIDELPVNRALPLLADRALPLPEEALRALPLLEEALRALPLLRRALPLRASFFFFSLWLFQMRACRKASAMDSSKPGRSSAASLFACSSSETTTTEVMTSAALRFLRLTSGSTGLCVDGDADMCLQGVATAECRALPLQRDRERAQGVASA